MLCSEFQQSGALAENLLSSCEADMMHLYVTLAHSFSGVINMLDVTTFLKHFIEKGLLYILVTWVKKWLYIYSVLIME